jgi:peptide chain release factor subunit 1
VPGKHKKGGWFALSQTHYERHIDHHVAMHLKDVVSRFEPFLKGVEIDRIVLGGSEDAILKTRELLPTTVADKIIGTFNAGMFERNSEILKKVEPVLSECESRLALEAQGDLIQKAMKQERAAVGLENVLKAVQEGRIMRLLLERDFKSGGKLNAVSHIVDLAVQRAVEQGAAVEMVSATGDFQRAGRIGAFLRF